MNTRIIEIIESKKDKLTAVSDCIWDNPETAFTEYESVKALCNLLKEEGFTTVAMALTDKSLPIDSPTLSAIPKLAIIMGTEGEGLPQSTIENADYVARIPMSHNVDSLNVAAAAAVAFWELRKK